MELHGYIDMDGNLHLFDDYNSAYEAWAYDNNAGVSSMPDEAGLRFVDHRTGEAPMRRSSRGPREGSFEHFVSLGQ